MKKRLILHILLALLPFTLSAVVRTGADRQEEYIPLLTGKRVGLVVNHTAVLSRSGTHLLDTLLSQQVNVTAIFAPEHGFRGTADAGEAVKDSRDARTGLPVISLYGKNKKPTAGQVADIDILLFDIQDVGARFYTYISTLLYVMQTCAETRTPIIILDRPNPNDHIDGPVLKEELKSFVGTMPLPVLHGLTIGELALMIAGEQWCGAEAPDVTVIPVSGWKHGDPYSLPVKPSPNLPDDQAVAYYPSLCFFEATRISVGRGTLYPFQVIGYPDPKYGKFSFTPRSLPGFDKNPLQKDKKCFGVDLRNIPAPQGLSLKYLLDFYRTSGLGTDFFSSPSFFDKLMGDKQVRLDILNGKDESFIRSRWTKELAQYRKMRQAYLLYPDSREDSR
ncbi:MAG: DUF1343 domain-containing protein [Coprobacter sp.]|nr:DUF1343 domain-containing protein [Coprobacter sp.]